MAGEIRIDVESISKAIKKNAVHNICMVHVGLRKVNSEAYKPVKVSIGPYHKDDDNLKAMQQDKERYLDSLLVRLHEGGKLPDMGPSKLAENILKFLHEIHAKQELMNLSDELAEFESKARKCYAAHPNLNSMSEKEFLKMMLLDGCFILEFLRKYDGEVIEFDKDDPIPRVQLTIIKIVSDMMLLENQLPYFVLFKLYEMTKCVEEKPLNVLAMSCFNYSLPRPRLYFNYVGEDDMEEINHLLHLVHILCCPLPEKTNKTSNGGGNSAQTTCITGESSDDQTRCPLLSPNCDSGNTEICYELKNQIRTVVKLQEYGVDFKKVDKVYTGELKKGTGNHYVSLFDIEFERHMMKIPCFKVDDSTETLLQNLIAYEQYVPDVEPKYFTDFAFLMNQLIHSQEDAEELYSEEIIKNFLVVDEELPRLFKRLANGIVESYEPYHLEVCEKVDKHCRNICNQWVAKLINFSNHSTTKPLLLLYLNVVQTLAALVTVFNFLLSS